MWNTDYERDCFNAYHRLNIGLLFKLDFYITTWTFPEAVSFNNLCRTENPGD